MNRRITAGITAFIISFSVLTTVQAAEDVPVLDKKITERLMDENKDGKKDFTDLTLSRSLYFDLKEIDDISFLKYADACEYLSLVNGSITDFSVLKEMKSIVSVQMNKITPENLSFLENQNIRYFNARDTHLSIEERLKYLRAEDITIPAGMVSVFSLYPINMFEGKLVIKNTDIAAFNEAGTDSEWDYMSGILYAKKAGETECSLIVDDTTVKTFRIKVTEPNYVTLTAVPDKVKTLSMENYYYNHKFTTFFHNSDGSLWTYESGEYKLFGTDVKEYRCADSSDGRVIYSLTNDGKIFIDGKPVIGITKPVKSIYCDKHGVYGMTENNDLWYTLYENGDMNTRLVCSSCSFFDENTGYFYGKDLNCFQVDFFKSQNTGKYTFQLKGIGKYEIKKVVAVSDKLEYMIDKNGVVYKITKGSSLPSVLQISKGASDIWISCPESEYSDGYVPSEYILPAFADADGRKYLIKNDNSTPEIKDPDKYCYFDTKSEIFKPAEREVNYLNYEYRDFKPSLFSDKLLDNDFSSIIVRKDKDKSAYISFCGYYLSAKNIENVCGADTDGEDYIIHILTGNGAVYEYYIAGHKFTLREFGTSSQPPAVVPSVTAVPEKTPSATPPATATPGKTPSAAPSAAATPDKTPSAAPSATSVPDKTPSAAPSAKPVYTAANYVSAVAYMNGTETASSSELDINKDGKINILDIILLKELVLKTK